MLTSIEWAWLLTTTAALLVASYFDFRDRLIPDKVWAIQILVGIVIDIYWYQTGPEFIILIFAILNVITALVLAVFIFITGALGGGDIKALFAISISSPIMFTIIEPLYPIEITFPAIMQFLINVFVVYILVALVFVSYNIFYKITRGSLFDGVDGSALSKGLLLFEGLRVDSGKLSELKHYDVLEQYEEDTWKLYTPRFEGSLTDEEFDRRVEQLKNDAITAIKQTGKQKIWVRPHIPGIPLFLIGYLLTVFFGPLLGFIFNRLLS